MELELKTWLQDIDRSIQEIYDFLPEQRVLTTFSAISKPEKLLSEISRLLVKR